MNWLTIATCFAFGFAHLARGSELGREAAATAACGQGLGVPNAPATLVPTGWSSVFGSYGLLRIKTAFEAKDASGRTFYVFDAIDGSNRTFEMVSREYKSSTWFLKALGDGGGQANRYIYEMILKEITEPSVAAPPNVVVKIEAENDGFRLERWKFELDGREQNLNFYDREEERRHIERKVAANAAFERHLAENPDPGSKAGIRKAIVDKIIAEGHNPAGYPWIDEEVERQWADMWHHITR